MTSRERFLAVFGGRMPDRVPVTLFIQDQGHFLEQMRPEADPHDHLARQLDVIEIQKELGLDVFVRMLFGLNDPLGIHCGGLNVSVQTEQWQVRQETLRDGNTKVIRSTITTPDGTLSQDFSIHRQRKATFMYGCTKYPIQTPGELDLAIRYEPPFLTPDKAAMIKDRVQAVNQSRAGPWVDRGIRDSLGPASDSG